jgi:hypothetical protein
MKNQIPKYPVYIPSKNRSDICLTANFFLKDKVDFKIVVEPKQYTDYKKVYSNDLLLILPEDNMKLLGSRLWIRDHSISNGYKRHWQFDDNISMIRRLHKGKRIRANANIAIYAVEQFTDRYLNIGLSGFNYTMFVTNDTKYPYQLNCHIYSATLINNEMPYKWRLYYNDDTDLCLQVLVNKLCTVLFNTFIVDKETTMALKGGNTDDLYKKDGRLIMARTLEEVWPEYVKTKWKFGRPQHVVKNSWRDFNHPLIRRGDIDWNNLESPKINLNKVAEIKSESLRKLYEDGKE